LTDADSQLLLARLRLRYWWMQRWREGSMARYPQALDELESALTLFRRSNATTEIAVCLVLLGDAVATLTDDLEHAQGALETAYDSFQTLNDDFYAAWALHFQAKLIGDTQGVEHGFKLLQQGLALRRRGGDQIGVCYSLYNLSTNLLLPGRLEECEQVTHEIITISRSTGEQSTLMVSQITLSLLELFAGHFEGAREQTEANARLAGNLNHEFGLVWCLLIRSLLDYFDGTSASTREGLQTSDTIATQAFMRFLVHWAYALLQQGDESTIKRHLLSAVHSAQGLGAYGALVWCLPAMAAWEARYGDPGKAASLLALAQQQPASLMKWLPKWLERSSIQSQLETKLGLKAFDAAYERGQNWELNQTVNSFLTNSAASAPESLTAPAHVQQANQQLIEPLSDRELEVLRCIAQGLSNREIANELVVELSTVKKHLTHVYGKLEVSTRAQAILRAQQLRLA
jgi:LuxR family maltose regulon positive regulatory protein